MLYTLDAINFALLRCVVQFKQVIKLIFYSSFHLSTSLVSKISGIYSTTTGLNYWTHLWPQNINKTCNLHWLAILKCCRIPSLFGKTDFMLACSKSDVRQVKISYSSYFLPGQPILASGITRGCIWVHLHPIHAPVICVVLFTLLQCMFHYTNIYHYACTYTVYME